MVRAADKVKDHERTVVNLMYGEVINVNSYAGKNAKTVALFGSYSQNSYISKKLADRLKTSECQENLLIASFEATKSVQYNTGVVKVGIQSKTGGVKPMKLREMDRLKSKSQCVVQINEAI